MNDEPPRSYSQESNPPDADPSPDSINPRPAIRRYKRASDEPESNARNLDEEIESLNARLQAIQAERRRSPAPAPAEPPRGARRHRLTRKNPPTVETRADGQDPEVQAPVPGLPSPVVERPRPLPVESLEPPPNLRWLYVLLVAGVLAGTMFFLGRVSVGTDKPVGIPKPATITPVWSPSQIAELDKILRVDASGNPAEAFRLARQLHEQTPGLDGLSRYLAFANARAGRVNDAEADTGRLIDPGGSPLAISAAHHQLAFIFGRRREFRSALDHFQSAAAADPFNPWTFYHWGEALRHQGRLEEAAGKFRQALLRAPAGQPETLSLRECAAFHGRLCLIEVGNDAEVKAATDEQLRTPAPGVYWWLTAAAYHLQHNNVPAGVDALTKAALSAPREQWESLLEDYLFRGYANRSNEVATFVPTLTNSRLNELMTGGRYLIDP